MSNVTTQLPTDTWVIASWDDYIKQIEDPACEKAKGYCGGCAVMKRFKR